MRKVKASNVRIGDFIAERPPVNGNYHDGVVCGVVDTLIHLSPNVFQVGFTNGTRAGFLFDDLIYRER